MTHPRSTATMAFLARVPRLVLILVVLAVLLGGFYLPGVPGAFLMLVLAGLVGWLAWLMWPSASAFTRALRFVVVLCFAAMAIQKLN